MIGHLRNNIYYATFNWSITTASVLNVLLLTMQAKATDFLSHRPERIKRDCITTLIKVNSLILSGAIIIGIMLFENDHTVCENTGMKLYTIFYYTLFAIYTLCLPAIVIVLFIPSFGTPSVLFIY